MLTRQKEFTSFILYFPAGLAAAAFAACGKQLSLPLSFYGFAPVLTLRLYTKGISDMVIISPSLLACDFSILGEMVADAEKGGAEYLHLDIMDGHFVPNLTFGTDVLKGLRPRSKMVFDTHLMLTDPYDYVPSFVKAGSDIITFHVESSSPIEKTIDLIHSFGIKAGLSIKPGTPVEAIKEYIPKLDLILVMSVEPGFTGQKFMPIAYEKIAALKEMRDALNPSCKISVDGGVGIANANALCTSGADILVAGAAVFRAPDIAKAVMDIRAEANR